MVLARVCRSRQRRVAFALTFRTHRTRYIIDIFYFIYTYIYNIMYVHSRRENEISDKKKKVKVII